jgi:ABC-type phosphonate transport system ATPase subunit
MRLSERERRMLAEIEYGLVHDDPRTARKFDWPPPRASVARRAWRRILRLLSHRSA